jgi:hypothetical protein
MKTKEQTSFDFDAFVSYSHADSERVKRLYTALTEKFNLQIFLDEKNIGIGPLHEQCAEGIRKSRGLVIVCSRTSLKSDWVRAEQDMMRARDPRGRSIVPIVLDDSRLPLELEALLWLDFKNQEEDGVNTAKLASLLLQISPPSLSAAEESIIIARDSPSPFQGNGTIPRQSQCYVQRSCDIGLRSLATSKSFVWVQGGYQMGKSSLLVRHADWVPEGWHISKPSLELCSKDEFWRSFFVEIRRTILPKADQREFNPADKWPGLRDLALRMPIALILDEIGICDGSNGRQLLRALLAIKEAAPAHFSCIAAFKGPPQEYLNLCRCDEPKLRDCWRVVSLPPFNRNEVQELATLLPATLASAFTARMGKVEEATGFYPCAVQRLLDNIWSNFQGFPNSSPAIINSIVDEQLASFSAT